MAAKEQELEVKKKQTPAETESTRDRRVYSPKVDIIERADDIVLSADMPGANEGSVDVTLDKGILTIQGMVDAQYFENYRLTYAEYGVGDYRRSFTIPDTIDRDTISAVVKNGVLTLTLPKAEPEKPKKIHIKAQ